MEKISVVLPTYNEKGNISNLLREIVRNLEGIASYEIIVVDDNSPDGTADEVRRASGEDGNIRLCVRENERGLATAVRKGIELSTGSVVVVMDTDFNPFQPPSIPTATATTPDDFVAFDSPPRLVHAEQPEYPDLARQAEAEGTVMIEVTIDENGRVIAARVFSSDTIEALESAALAAALKFLFEPAKQRDVPVKCRIHIPFGFGLGG